MNRAFVNWLDRAQARADLFSHFSISMMLIHRPKFQMSQSPASGFDRRLPGTA